MSQAIFAGVTTAVSIYSFYRYFTSTEPKKPVPIHFDWWGTGDNTVKHTALGAAIYPALTLVINALESHRGGCTKKSASSPPPVVASDGAAGSGSPFRRCLPYFGRRFLMWTSVAFMLYAQEVAHDISLGKRDKMSTSVLRPFVGLIVGVSAVHYLAGTQHLLK